MDGDYTRLTTCPNCGGLVKLYTSYWLGESQAKAAIETIRILAGKACEKCNKINEVENGTEKVG
jgi:RNA polymerase subunit RPABC4/transcription elongation factor Spt4